MQFTTDDGVAIYFEDSGPGDSGQTVIFAHEFAGEAESWRDQVEHLKDRYRCIAYNARGWPPSDVPEDGEAYSLERAVADLVGLMDHLELEKAHLVGLSMGTNTVLKTVQENPGRCLSMTLSSTAYGSMQNGREEFQQQCLAMSERLLDEGWETMAAQYGRGPFRLSFLKKRPAEHAEFQKRLAAHSSLGSALTQRAVQARRPSFYEQETALKAIDLPVLLMIGDDDQPGWEGTLYLKRMIPTSGLLVFPRTGHQTNLEEPEIFNAALENFLKQAEAGTWGRHPDSEALF